MTDKDDGLYKVWPFGEGVLATGYDCKDGLGIMMIRALPDGFTKDTGAEPWEAWEASVGHDAPYTTLTFNSSLAVRNFADELQHLATAMDQQWSEDQFQSAQIEKGVGTYER